METQAVTREFREKQIWAVRFRCGILLGLAGIYLALVAFAGVQFNAYALLCLAPLFTLNEVRRLCHSRGIHNDLLTELCILSDLATIGVIIYFTGGVESILVLFLFVQVAGTSLHTNFRAGLKTAAGATALFALLAWSEQTQLVGHSPFMSTEGHAVHCLSRSYVTSASLVVGFALFMASLSSGYVAKRLRVREDELAEVNRQLVRLYRETQKLSLTDELTGAFNRRHLTKRLAEEVTRSGRYTRPLSLLMLDVDHFKKVNDVHGHPVGDAVLKEVAARVSRELRESDFLARYGGEEFTVLLPETPLDGARQVAERIRQRVALEPITAGPTELSISVSVGVAAHPAFKREGTDPVADLLAAADARLYRAKKAGRNRVVACDQPQQLLPEAAPEFSGTSALQHA